MDGKPAMKASLVIVFILLRLLASAQNKTIIIYKDTINITGYIYYDNGQPATGTAVTSKEKDLKYNKFILTSVTNDKGFFELKGARLNDTLDVKTPFAQYQYFNRGARYLLISVPAPLARTIPTTTPLVVKAVRKNARKATKFTIQPYKTTEIYSAIEQMPQYPGGSDKFYKYLQSKLSYPVNAVNAGIEGTAEANFTILKDGSIGSVKIVRGIGYGCDELLLSVLKDSLRWTPGRFYGRPVEVTFTVSVEFKLTGK